MNDPAIKKFLEKVLVWPDAQSGWINLHVNAKNSNPSDTSKKNNFGKAWNVGWPFKTVDDFLDFAGWCESTPTFFNSWVCMSQQNECAKKPNGKAKAIRKSANATWFKSLWIDCDVKAGDPKHYATLTEAWDAIDAFRIKVGLPSPSVAVNSGGGLHIYWASDAPLTTAEWRTYADGLKALLLRERVKCDTGLTTDAARLLRVPGTLNHKYDPPRPVELLHFGTVYDFPTALSVLRGVALAKSAAALPSAPARSVIEPGYESEFENGPDPAFASLTGGDDLAAGIGRCSNLPLDPAPVFDKCGFMRRQPGRRHR